MKSTALITGATSGIGLELARIFAKNKINLLLTARKEIHLKNLAEELSSKFNISVNYLALDLSIGGSTTSLFDYSNKENLQIDYLVNNAGFGDFGMFKDSDWNKQLQMINLNITALTHLTHLFLPKMIARNSGKILNVASTAAFQPGPTMSVYYATKAYVLHFSEAIGNELNNTKITVTALCPGATESGFQAAAAMEESALIKGKKLPTSKEVAAFGYKAMIKGKSVAIHGKLNYILANVIRFLPRSVVVKVTRKVQE
jgi:uncharacterized protein